MAGEVIALRRSFTARFEAEGARRSLVVELEGGSSSGERIRCRLAVDLGCAGVLAAASRGAAPPAAAGAALQAPLPYALTGIAGEAARAGEVSRAVVAGAAEWGAVEGGSGGGGGRGLLTAMVRAASKACARGSGGGARL